MRRRDSNIKKTYGVFFFFKYPQPVESNRGVFSPQLIILTRIQMFQLDL